MSDEPDWEAVARRQLALDLRRGKDDILDPAIRDFERAIEDAGDVEERYELLVHKCDEFAGYAHSIVQDLDVDADEPRRVVERLDERGRT